MGEEQTELKNTLRELLKENLSIDISSETGYDNGYKYARIEVVIYLDDEKIADVSTVFNV
jgi:hypothetical protein